MSVQRYVIYDNGTSAILNAIVWDGVATWSPPAGETAVQSDTQMIGATYSIP